MSISVHTTVAGKTFSVVETNARDGDHIYVSLDSALLKLWMQRNSLMAVLGAGIATSTDPAWIELATLVLNEMPPPDENPLPKKCKERLL